MQVFATVGVSIFLIGFMAAFLVWFTFHMLRALALVSGNSRAYKKHYRIVTDALARGERMPDSLAKPRGRMGPRDNDPFYPFDRFR